MSSASSGGGLLLVSSSVDKLWPCFREVFYYSLYLKQKMSLA